MTWIGAVSWLNVSTASALVPKPGTATVDMTEPGSLPNDCDAHSAARFEQRPLFSMSRLLTINGSTSYISFRFHTGTVHFGQFSLVFLGRFDVTAACSLWGVVEGQLRRGQRSGLSHLQ